MDRNYLIHYLLFAFFLIAFTTLAQDAVKVTCDSISAQNLKKGDCIDMGASSNDNNMCETFQCKNSLFNLPVENPNLKNFTGVLPLSGVDFNEKQLCLSAMTVRIIIEQMPYLSHAYNESAIGVDWECFASISEFLLPSIPITTPIC
jgi:hypothetical protein